MPRRYDFELFLMRHGVAEPAREGGDAARELTEAGREALALAARAMARFEWWWSDALTSPLVRARQTEAIVRAGLDPAHARVHRDALRPARTSEALIPSAPAHAAARAIVEAGSRLAGPRPRLAVFGHNPCLSRVASLLVCGEASERVPMGRGDLLHLLVPAPSPFDLILDPKEEGEPLPTAILLGFYGAEALSMIGRAERS